jgi:hypothetical protein
MMRRARRSVAVAALLALSATGSVVGDSETPATPLAAVRFQTDDRLMVVPVAVDGVPLWFYLDTGAPHSVVDASAAARLRLQIVRSDSGAGAGRGAVPRKHAAPLTLSVGGAMTRVKDPWIFDLSHVGTSRHIDGLIGVDFMQAYVLRVDPGTRTLELFAPGAHGVAGSGTAIPLIVRDGKLFVVMRLKLPNRAAVAHVVRVDTGSDDAVSDDLVRESSTRRISVQGVGLGRSYKDYSGLFVSVQLGPYTIRDVWGPSNDVPTVGMEILRRFVLTIDVPGKSLRLAPNAYFSDPVPSPAPGQP